MATARPGKLIRISEDAHQAAKVAAAINNVTLEEWASQALVEAGRAVRYDRSPKAVASPRKKK